MMQKADPGGGSSPATWLPRTIKTGLVVTLALVMVYVALVVHTRRLTLFAPGLPKPHVVGRFTATVLAVNYDSTAVCIAHSGVTGQLCGLLYSHVPVTKGERLTFVEAIVPTADGSTTTVLIVNPTD